MTTSLPTAEGAPARVLTTAVVVVLLASLAGCFCPPQVADYSSPAATLSTWQAQLCHDDDVGEYSCLSNRLQKEMGGFETYFAARRELLAQSALLSWMLRHADLASRAVDTELAPDGQAAAMRFEYDEQRMTIGFALETRALFELDDGEVLPALQKGPIPVIMQRVSGREWLDLTWPRRFDDEDKERIVSITIEPQWKIDAIEGLMASPQVTE